MSKNIQGNFKEIQGLFKDKATYFEIQGLFKDNLKIQGLFKGCANHALIISCTAIVHTQGLDQNMIQQKLHISLKLIK